MKSPDITRSKMIPEHVPKHLLAAIDWYGMTELGSDPFVELAKLHDGEPIIFVGSNVRNSHGSWLITREADIRTIVMDTDHFTSENISGFDQVIEGFNNKLIPTEIDPPDHAAYRTFMAPYFSPSRINGLDQIMRDRVRDIIAQVGLKGKCEFMSEATYYMAIAPWCEIMGMRYDEADQWIRFPVQILQYTSDRPKLMAEMIESAKSLYLERKDTNMAGLIAHFINTPSGGQIPSEASAIGFIIFMLIAGVDTVGGTLGFAMKRLAEDQKLRAHLTKGKDDVSIFVEEVLRRHAVVSTNRYVKKDVSIAGVQMRCGDNIILPMSLANSDPKAFERPLELDLARKRGRIMTFGAGIHTCIGSRLARAVIGIAVEEWLAAIPNFRIDSEKPLIARVGDVIALTSLPLQYEPI
ncbi:MAG: cytochrome P450 [Halieaceae bacterium]|nr:cytochrome P450 [Halieaceae bacterium]